MQRALGSIAALIAATYISGAGAALAAPLFTLSPDGQTFLYQARRGDHPAVVAEMFGLPHDVDALLAANGITDPTRVEPGFVYRIPNPVALRSERLAAENEQLTRAARESEERARAAERDAADTSTRATVAERVAARLAPVESRWSMAKVGLGLLGLALIVAGALSVSALRRKQQAEQYARTLAVQLEEKQRSVLTERQESARRVLDLENRIRALEVQLGPRVVVGGGRNG